MKKSDLKNRMIVECRNGNRYMVIGDMLLSTNSYIGLDNYSYEDLTMETIPCPEYDIMKVYDRVHYIDFIQNLDLLWERSEVKEVTMEEVEEKFGCKVKIVKE